MNRGNRAPVARDERFLRIDKNRDTAPAKIQQNCGLKIKLKTLAVSKKFGMNYENYVEQTALSKRARKLQ